MGVESHSREDGGDTMQETLEVLSVMTHIAALITFMILLMEWRKPKLICERCGAEVSATFKICPYCDADIGLQEGGVGSPG